MHKLCMALIHRACNITLLISLVSIAFSPAVNKWFVCNVMNSDDLKKHNHMLLKFDHGARRNTVIPEEEPDTDGQSEDMVNYLRLYYY